MDSNVEIGLLKILAENQTFKQIKREIEFSSFFHAMLINSQDEITNVLLSKLIALTIVCEKSVPCFECAHCLKVLAGSHPDVKIVNENKKLLVEDVDKIQESLNLKPMLSESKVYILNNFSLSTPQSMNKLLKVLEEPPKGVFFILNTTSLDGILPTIKSRCKSIDVAAFDNTALLTLYKKYLPDFTIKQEALEASEGMIGKLMLNSQSDEFFASKKLAHDIVFTLRSSKDVLPFSQALSSSKDDFLTKLRMLESYFEDILFCINKKDDIIKNRADINLIKSISGEFTPLAIAVIDKEIIKAKTKFELNVALPLICDNLLLKILEVKYKCKQK